MILNQKHKNLKILVNINNDFHSTWCCLVSDMYACLLACHACRMTCGLPLLLIDWTATMMTTIIVFTKHHDLSFCNIPNHIPYYPAFNDISL